MARFLNKNLPGIRVPEALIEEIGGTADRTKAGIAISVRIIQELKGLCQGIHLIPAGSEKMVPPILDAAKL
jgi:5,10-methylenetetrahydrofolate reductase